jgi:hypothetical protein
MFPPLGVFIVCAICYYSFCEQLIIGRLLFEAEERGYSWYVLKLANDLIGTVEFFIPAIFPLMMIASLLFAALLFDTFGDHGTVEFGIIFAILTSLLPLVLWVCGWWIDWRGCLRHCRTWWKREVFHDNSAIKTSNKRGNSSGSMEMRKSANPLHESLISERMS